VFTLSRSLDDEGEIEEGQEDDIKFLESGKDAAESL
jgi:hypothetical protein